MASVRTVTLRRSVLLCGCALGVLGWMAVGGANAQSADPGKSAGPAAPMAAANQNSGLDMEATPAAPVAAASQNGGLDMGAGSSASPGTRIRGAHLGARPGPGLRHRRGRTRFGDLTRSAHGIGRRRWNGILSAGRRRRGSIRTGDSQRARQRDLATRQCAGWRPLRTGQSGTGRDTGGLVDGPIGGSAGSPIGDPADGSIGDLVGDPIGNTNSSPTGDRGRAR